MIVDDVIYVGDTDLFAIDANSHSLLWHFAPSEGVLVGRHPPVYWNGMLLVGSGNGYVYAVDAKTGTSLWTTRLSTSAVVDVWLGDVVDGALSLTVTDFSIAANHEPQGSVGRLDAATGTVQWLREIPHHIKETGPTASLAPVTTAGVVVAGARDGPAYGFDASTGAVRWTLPPLLLDPVDPALSRDIHVLEVCGAKLFIGSSQSTRVVALDPATGTELWRTPPHSASPEEVWCEENALIVMRPLGGIQLLDAADGHTLWELGEPTRYDFNYGALSDGGVIYSGGYEGVYALRAQ